MFKAGDAVASKNWSPVLDAGQHHRVRLGFILMSTDLAAEVDFFDMVRPDVVVQITLLKTEDYTANKTLARHIDHMADAAARIQPDLKPDVLSFSCTSGSIVMGEHKFMAEIAEGAPWTRPMCLVQGALDALNALNARCIVVGTLYPNEVNTADAEYLLAKGFEALYSQGLNMGACTEMGQVTPAFWKGFALAIDGPDADAIFLSYGGILAPEVVEEIEAAVGKPVITWNQAQCWRYVRRAGIANQVTGFGQIFQNPGTDLLPAKPARAMARA